MTVTTVSTSPSRRIASEVRAEAARQGISHREIARRLGVSQPWVGRRISVHADVDLTFEDLEKISEALGVSAQRLMGAAGWLPRLDSNQQPSGYRSPQVTRRKRDRRRHGGTVVPMVSRPVRPVLEVAA